MIINYCDISSSLVNSLYNIRMRSNLRSNITSDISQDNQSKLTIPMADYLQLKEDIKKVKYPTYAISQAEKL